MSRRNTGGRPHMHTDVFEWKSAGRGPHYRFSVGESSVVLERDGYALSIDLDDIARPDKPWRFFLAGVILLALTGLMWAFMAYLLDQPDRAWGIASGLAICFIFGTLWSLRETKRQTPIDAESLLKKLQNPVGGS